MEDSNRISLSASLSESLTCLRTSADLTPLPTTVTPFDTGCKSSVLEQIELRTQQREADQKRRRGRDPYLNTKSSGSFLNSSVNQTK